MSILSVDNISPIGSGTSVTVNNAATLVVNNVSISGVTTITGHTGNVRLDLHATASGTGSQIKLHNDHGTAYFGQAGDTSGDLLVYNESSTDIKFFTNGNNERLSIDSSGRVLIGQTSIISGIFGSLPPRFSVSTPTASPAIFATFSNDTYASRVDLLKSRNATVGSHTVVQAGDALGEIYFGGSDGDQFHGGALIQAVVESGVGNDDMPANLRFYTNGGATTVTERLRITSSGKISYNYDGSFVSSIADVDIRTNNGLHIRGVNGNADNANIYIGGAVNNQRKTAIIHDPVGGYCRGDLHFCLENSADLSDVDVTDSKMKISAAGYVTKPNHPSFLAGRTGGNQSFTVGTFPLNVARVNVGNHYSTSTYKFTAPVAGVYYFFAQVYYNNGAGQYRMGFRKTPSGGSAIMLNTSSHKIDAGHPSGANDTSDKMSIIESLAVGDTVELYSDQNHNIQCYYDMNGTSVGSHTHFGGYLIG